MPRACKAQPVQLVLQGPMVQQVQMELPELPVQQVFKDYKDSQVYKA